jgi:hypothetical protein
MDVLKKWGNFNKHEIMIDNRKVFEYIMVSLTCVDIQKMKKLLVVLPLLLTACGDDEAKRIKELEAQQYQARMQLEQNQQQIAAQQQQMYAQQQQNAQPQYAPQAPVVVQQPQHDNTIMNMAVGALAGHAISSAMNNSNNDRQSERVVEHKTVVIDNRQPIASSSNFQNTVAPSVPSPTVAEPKKNYMDMNKLSESAKYSPPSSNNVVASRQSMDMSKFSKPSTSSTPPRPSSMNMSKLSRR